jgi:hypothetical protein
MYSITMSKYRPVRQPEGPGVPALVLLLEELVWTQREEVWPHPHYNRIQCFMFIIYILEKPAETQTTIWSEHPTSNLE